MARWVSALLALAVAFPASAQFQTAASHAVIMDFETGRILYSKNGDEPMPPASMSKIMTMLMVFERIAEGGLTLEDEVPVSEDAWRRGGAATGGSTMFLEVNSRVAVGDLVRGVIVQSGNDACIALAEALEGSEESFADAMNRRAEDLGLAHSTFRNATGWPHPEHRVSARDLAEIARVVIRDHPELYEIYAQPEFTWNGIRQFNRNPLLGNFPGADGMKTGHTEESGYGLVGSAVRDDVRRIIVFNGLENQAARAREAERLMRAAFADFRVHTPFEAGAIVGEVPVVMGQSETVPVAVVEPITLAYHRGAVRDATARVVFDGPLVAPIAEGQAIGELIVEAPGSPVARAPVVAAAPVEGLSLMQRATASLIHMIRKSANG